MVGGHAKLTSNTEDEPVGSRRMPLVMLACLALAVAAGYGVAATAPDFETLALGAATQAAYGSYEGDKIFCGSPAELPECLGPAARRNLPKRLVWLGNSQLHAINQTRAGDVTAPVLLARRLRPGGVEVQALSFPNASLAELYLAYLLERRAHRIDVLVVPLFLDDTREGSIRDVLRDVAVDPAIRPRLQTSPAGRAILGVLPAVTETDVTLQGRSEAAITRALEVCCGFQTMREQARGQFSIGLYRLRNTLFGVNAQSVRPLIPAQYAFHMAALDRLLADAAADGTRVITYVAPLRQDVAAPYIPADYARFKAETRAVAARQGAIWVDLDAIVPAQLWGTKDATRVGGAPEIDFMHFQGPGHAIVAASVEPYVAAALR